MTDMRAGRFFSYAQNLEDYHLALLLADVERGFYIDVGGGHAVADNVSFWFYEKGWRGIVVEPQATIAAAYRIVRPRDVTVEALCGAEAGEAVLFQAERFHGLSTTVKANAEAAGAAVCDRRAAPAGDDAEGSRRRPCAGGDRLPEDRRGGRRGQRAGRQ